MKPTANDRFASRRGMTRFLVLACAIVTFTAHARQTPAQELGWIGLFTPALIEWLENENRLEELCAASKKDSEAWQACRRQHLAPQERSVRLWHGPSGQAAPAGVLRLVATPGKGLRSIFVPLAGGAGAEFRPDLFDSDWGYGPYFHVTFLERQKTWFRLPEDPFAKDTWLNAADLGADSQIRVLQAGDIVTGPMGDLFVIGLESGVLRARAEQPADMWCRASTRPPLKPWKELRIPFRDLFTATGHLQLHIKYTRGC